MIFTHLVMFRFIPGAGGTPGPVTTLIVGVNDFGANPYYRRRKRNKNKTPRMRGRPR